MRKHFKYDLNQKYLSILYQTIISTGYFGLFHIGELTTGDHPVLASDVHIGLNKRKILFILRTSKTHWKNSKLQSVKICSQKANNSTDTEYPEQMQMKAKVHSSHAQDVSIEHPCPYELLRTYAKLRGPFACKESEPFFVFRGGIKVTPGHMQNCLKKMLKMAGYDQTLYSFHSLRIGQSQDLLKYGLSVETIKKLGWWKSNAVFKYLH